MNITYVKSTVVIVVVFPVQCSAVNVVSVNEILTTALFFLSSDSITFFTREASRHIYRTITAKCFNSNDFNYNITAKSVKNVKNSTIELYDHSLSWKTYFRKYQQFLHSVYNISILYIELFGCFFFFSGTYFIIRLKCITVQMSIQSINIRIFLFVYRILNSV